MIVSIDIGTSYSSICMLGPDGKVHPVDISTGASMFGGKYSLPSAVFVEDSGNVLVGQAAMNSRKHKPQNFRMEFKRNLGEDIPILLGERSFKPEELYTELFRHMKACAEKVSGETVEKAYLTYPASYREKRREKLRSAAKAAGIFDLELVDEPTAAAMCYCAEGYIKDGQTLLVYDFGGGTFDVSLIKYQNGEFQLLSEPMGLERCGGMDVDYLIAQDMREVIEREIPGAWDNLQKNQNRFLRFTSQINELAVKAKHHLSSAGSFEEYIEMGMDDVPYKLTVERFNEMIAPLAGQTLQTCRQAIDEAGISASDVSAVLMVGGTSRIPLVREMTRKITGKPALSAADLELAVVWGALAYRLASPQESKADGPGKPGPAAEEYYQKGERAREERKWEEAVKWYNKAADQGHPEAMFLLFIFYTEGKVGVARDPERGLEWLRKAADIGNVGAMDYLGYGYEKGEYGLPKDEERARQWNRKFLQLCLEKAGNGDTDCMCRLGEAYQGGYKGVAEDKEQALQWYRKAAALNDIKAIRKIGDAYSTDPDSVTYEYNDLGLSLDYHQAMKWYQKGIELGDSSCMHELGECYKKQGNDTETVKWYRRAAELGDWYAAWYLSRMYRDGRSVPKDKAKAFQWYCTSAELGSCEAVYNLGMAYMGEHSYEECLSDIQKDYRKAAEWFRKGTEYDVYLDTAKCCERLGYLYEKGLGLPKDLKQAVQWYRTAADLGNGDAKKRLQELGER